MSRLIDNLKSDYLAAYAGLCPKSQPKSVIVYVESDEDIAFWRSILSEYENAQIKFEINLPSATSLAKGKKQVLARYDEIFDVLREEQLGQFLIRGAILQLDIKPDGKIWIQYDGIEEAIANVLVERGVPKQDIVAPYKRPYTGFAVA